jgi:flagellar hook-associated protein 1 FlgK
MADLLSILNNSARGLAAHQGATATASHNLQNVNTPGFSRQRAELEATLPAETLGGRGQIGRGVNLLTISQARDQFLERQMPGALSSQARSSTQSSALQTVSALDPDAPGGLASILGDFYSAMRQAAQNPGEPGLRAALVAAGRTLGFTFNRTVSAVSDARTGIDEQLKGVIDVVNDAASAVARLNTQIKAAMAGGISPNDQLDQRQKYLDRLAELTGATQVRTGTGEINVVLPGGRSLVTGNKAAQLIGAADAGNLGHLAISVQQADGSPPVLLANNQIGGSASGLLDARDGALRDSEERLDQLAFDLAGNINAAHQAGFGLDGSSGRDFFSVSATAVGAARTLEVHADIIADPSRIAAAASAGTLPGDASNLQAIIATEYLATTSGADPGKTVGRIAADYGAAASGAMATAEQDGAILGHLQEMRESVNGVSIDEELINLTKSQRAFEAIMKVLTTADDMLKTLMSLR